MRSATASALTLAWAKKHVKALPVPADGASGVDGAPGPAGADGKDGAQGPQGYGFAPVGKYEHGKVYFGASPENPYFQVVEYMGSSYAALDANGVGGRPPGPGWVLLAAKGAKGDGGGRGGGSAQGGAAASYDQSLNTTDSVEFAALSINGAPVITPTGTPDGTKYLRDDNTWQPVPGSTSAFAYIDFNEVPGVAGQPRRLMWNATDGTLDLGMNNGSVTQQIGLEQFYRVKASLAITNGQCVMATGTEGNSGVITAAPVLTPSSPEYVIGVATEDIAQGDFGFITNFGKVRGIRTNGGNYGETWVDGTILYANGAASGRMTSTRPDVDPVIVAIVINAHPSNGELFIRVTDDGVRWDRISGKPTLSYNATFNATTDWSGAGPYTISIPQATHACGTVLGITAYKSNGDGTYSIIGNTVDDVGMVNTSVNASTGNVTLTASAKFAGQIVITRSSGTGTGSFDRPIDTVTANVTLTVAHYTVLVDASAGDVTVTLPSAASVPHRMYVVKKIDASVNDVIFSGTLDGDADKRIGTRYTSLTIQSDGTSWWIL